MTKIHVISGFLGAGKTTLIKKLLQEAFQNQKIVLIENEFGEIGIDGGFLKEAGIEITEMNSGCICCSLVGDFGEALGKVLDTYAPDHILIEPSGVGKLSDVIKAIQDIAAENGEVQLGGSVTVADASKCKIYMKNFGEFFNNQIEHAQTIILSRTQNLSQEKLNTCVALIQEHNTSASIITTPWDQLSGEKILSVIEKADSLAQQLLEEENEHHHHHHHEDGEECHCHEHDHEHHHHHEDGEECHCHDHEHEHEHHHHHEDGEECHCHDHDHEHHHHHEDGEECHCHDHDHEHHHHHEDGEECHCHDHEHEHEHHHHHEDGEECHCHCHEHGHHHHHHHADEVFTSWGKETARQFTMEEVQYALTELNHEDEYGIVLRAKGILPAADGSWIHFDFVPEESNVRIGAADYTGRLCVIGSKLKEDALAALFHLN